MNNFFLTISFHLSNNSKKILGYFLIVLSAIIGFTFFYLLYMFNFQEHITTKIILLSTSSLFYWFGLFLIKQNIKVNELVDIANCLQYINFYINYDKLPITNLIYMIFVLDVYYFEQTKKSLLIECNWQIKDGIISNESVEALIYSYLDRKFNLVNSHNDLIIIERMLKNVDFLKKFIKIQIGLIMIKVLNF
jgi:hypothetical protein